MILRNRNDINAPACYCYSPTASGVEAYPMIAVPNPNDIDGTHPHMYVFRPWTLEEARKTTEGMPNPQEDVQAWETALTYLINSYTGRLNGVETGEGSTIFPGKVLGKGERKLHRKKCGPTATPISRRW